MAHRKNNIHYRSPFQDVTLGRDKNGHIFFYGKRPDGRTVRVSLSDALQSATATEYGLQLSGGSLIPWETEFLGAKRVVLQSNAAFERTYLKTPPRRAPQPNEQEGITIYFHQKGKKGEFVRDYRSKFGQFIDLDKAFNAFIRIISYELFGRSDILVYLEGNLNGLSEHANAHNQIASEDRATVVIDKVQYFRDKFITSFPKERGFKSRKGK